MDALAVIEWASHQSWYPGFREGVVVGGPVLILFALWMLSKAIDQIEARVKALQDAIHHLRQGHPPDY